MIRLKNNRQKTTRNVKQFSLMITIREEERTLGLRKIKNSVSNPDTEARTTRHPIDQLASTQIELEIRTEINNITKTDQVTVGTSGPTTVSKLSKTSMLDQRTQILNTIKTFHRVPIYLHPTQFNSSTTRDKM